MQVLRTLGLNWKLFIAQAINFSIILFILWRWVFKPVAGALEARRQKIEESVKKAEEIERAKGELAAARERQLKQTRLEAENVLNKALAEAQNIKQETVTSAQKEAEKILANAQRAMAVEKDQMMRELREEVATLTVMAVEKILHEKLDGKKDSKMIQEVLSKMK